jgi:hypothetical protein
MHTCIYMWTCLCLCIICSCFVLERDHVYVCVLGSTYIAFKVKKMLGKIAFCLYNITAGMSTSARCLSKTMIVCLNYAFGMRILAHYKPTERASPVQDHVMHIETFTMSQPGPRLA